MKVLVLGGAGSMAYATIRDLMEIDIEEVSKVVIADRYYEKVKKVADEFESGKLTPAWIDVTDHAKLVKLMNGFDVVLDETGTIPVGILKAALETRVHLINLGVAADEGEQCMDMSDEFEKAGLTAILGLGSSPGITNLMAKALIDKLDTVKTIEVSFAYASLGRSTLPLKVPFLGALDEFFTKPLVFRDGQFVELPPQSGLEDIQYPEPIGIRKSFYVPHEEVWGFPVSFEDKGIKNVTVKAGFTPDFVEKVNFLIGLGIISEEPLKVNDATVAPMDVLTACLAKLPPEQGEVVDYGCSRVIARGRGGGEELEYTALMFNRPYRGLTNAQHRTGHSPSIGARMLFRGEIKKRGVFLPEMVIEPKLFFKELAKRELEVAVTSRTFI